MDLQQSNSNNQPDTIFSRFPLFSLLCGIFALISCCTPPLQFFAGAAAVLLAYFSKQGKPMKKPALVGMILGIVSIVCSLLIFFYYMTAMQILGDPANAPLVRDIMRQYQDFFNSLQQAP